MENKKIKCNPMSKEFQEEAKRLNLTGGQLIQKYKDEDSFGGIVERTVDNKVENVSIVNNENIICPNCDSDNLQELLHTPSGIRTKCLDCEEVFVNNVNIDSIIHKKEKEKVEEYKPKIELMGNSDNDNDLIIHNKGSKNIRKKYVNKEIKRSEEILDNYKKYYVVLNGWEKGEGNGKYISIEKYEARNSKIYKEGKVWIDKQQLTVTNLKTLDKIIEELTNMRSELDECNE